MEAELRPASAGAGQKLRTDPECAKSTVYFDGSCPLCRAEIGYYGGKDQTGALDFVDVSAPGAVISESVTQARAMQRFHVRAGDGRMLSGAAAFVEVWSRLPGWRWAARGAARPGVLPALELAYRLFLPVRPYISRMFGAIQRHLAARITPADER